MYCGGTRIGSSPRQPDSPDSAGLSDYPKKFPGCDCHHAVSFANGNKSCAQSYSIEKYMELSQQVFSVDQVLSGVIPVGDDQCRFDCNQLEHMLQRTVREELHDENAIMADTCEQKISCPTFVVATKGFNADGPPTLFRSYKCEGFSLAKCKNWEAGRATSAAPSLFKAMFISIPTPGGWYVDGGMSHNNPAELALQEAERIWPVVERFGLVRIGAGRQRSVTLVEKSEWGMQDVGPSGTYIRMDPQCKYC